MSLERLSKDSAPELRSRWRERTRIGHTVEVAGLNVAISVILGTERVLGNVTIRHVTAHGKRKQKNLSVLSLSQFRSRYERTPDVVQLEVKCERCNYDEHTCPACGESLTHSGHESSGIYHDIAWCRPDLVRHKPGPDCTWPDKPELRKIHGYKPWCYWDHDADKLSEPGETWDPHVSQSSIEPTTTSTDKEPK